MKKSLNTTQHLLSKNAPVPLTDGKLISSIGQERPVLGGRCYYFNGVDSYVNLGNSTAFDVTGTMTFEVWVNYVNKGTNKDHIIFNKETTIEATI